MAQTTGAQTTGVQGKRLVLFCWIFVGFFYFWLSYDYIRVTMSDDQLVEYLRFVVQVSGDQYRPNKEIRELILVKAGELNLPVQGHQITIRGSGSSLNVAVDYSVDIAIPGLERGIYTKHFAHKVDYGILR